MQVETKIDEGEHVPILSFSPIAKTSTERMVNVQIHQAVFITEL